MREYKKIFEKFLQCKDLKLTKERKAILNAVFATHKHFDIDYLTKIFQTSEMNISKATIYRTIPLLMQANLIRKAITCLSKDTYEHTYGHPEHFHFICRICGAIIERKIEKIKVPIENLSQEDQFFIEKYNVEVSGLCRTCKIEKNNV